MREASTIVSRNLLCRSVLGAHIRKHEKELQERGYQNVEHAIWDVARNFTAIYEGTKKNGLRLIRPLSTIIGDGKLGRTVLQVELVRSGEAYRVSSIFFTRKRNTPKEEKLLWGRNPSNRLLPVSRDEPVHPDFTGPQQPSGDSIEEVVVGVNKISRRIETEDDARLAQINREAMQIVEQMPDNLGVIDRGGVPNNMARPRLERAIFPRLWTSLSNEPSHRHGGRRAHCKRSDARGSEDAAARRGGRFGLQQRSGCGRH